MPPYKHGRITHTVEDWYDIALSDQEYELLSDEEMDDYFRKLEKGNDFNVIVFDPFFVVSETILFLLIISYSEPTILL